MNLNEVSKQHEPLSWTEARSHLREVLEDYLQDPNPKRKKDTNFDYKHNSLVSFCISCDLDLYAGALFFSLLLLILTCTSFFAKRDGFGQSLFKPKADLDVYIFQVSAAVLLCSGSLLSLWMVRRRRFLCLNDSSNSKRREILKFLRSIEVDEEHARTQGSNIGLAGKSNNSTNFSGTAQTDIYPVYRKVSDSKGSESASWNRIPSLLLVRGDFLALQVGDIVPANCVAINDLDSPRQTLRLNIGERLSILSLNENTNHVIESLPKGRTTLQPNSKSFLTLCNNLQIFRVVETPMKDFIRRATGSTEVSQISRQVNDIRACLSLLSIPIFIVASLAVFARPKGTFADITLVSPLPILAALGILPVVGPFFIFTLEVIGTARILATVHPHASPTGGHDGQTRKLLLLRYIFATGLSRLSLWEVFDRLRGIYNFIFPGSNTRSTISKLVRVPPATLNVLEKLGVVTALALIDDELVCEPHSIPQQLLIPSGRGMKLLDLCPEYDNESVNDSVSDDMTARRRGKSFDSDSESDDSREKVHGKLLHRKLLRRRGIRRPKGVVTSVDTVVPESFDVQFEEPNWWQHLPSLKCIGLACLLTDRKKISEDSDSRVQELRGEISSDDTVVDGAKKALARLICDQRQSQQLQSLAECIGFSTQLNSLGDQGDISPFSEELRLHVLSHNLFRERLEIDAHERSSEQSRWWGLIRPDATSVVVKDDRTHSYQLLTVGDPTIVTNLCNEAWQGEISTILPLAASDKQTIIETTNNWKLADLDVAAFCYSPVPLTLENWLASGARPQSYLLDHSGVNPPLLKDKTISKEWAMIRNQVFLGVLGSLVVPRREIQKLLDILSDAGVRFVYFSPRNMRRQKELAIQMGIDVAWNCAISLRPLESGEEDPHRMVSNYADWDVNAKLPHGIEDVRKHLKEVDNVPLLVSLFTDVTKFTTRQMVEIFQEHSDTVLTIGLSHLPTNDGIFSVSAIAVGIDVLSENSIESSACTDHFYLGSTLPSELEFVSSIAAHSCAFRFRGAASVSNISTILNMSRASLEAAIAATIFGVSGCLSFSLFVLFSLFMPSSVLTYVPMLGAVAFLQLVLPGMSLALSMTDSDKDNMKRVPPKNDKKVIFGRNEGFMLYSRTLLKAILPALLPQIWHPILYAELMQKVEPVLVASLCPGSPTLINIIQCEELKEYSSNVRLASGCFVLVHFMICIIGASAGYVHRFHSVFEIPPWKNNHTWAFSVVSAVGLVVTYVVKTTAVDMRRALPWYYYCSVIASFFFCIAWVEWWKKSERKLESRAEKLRRLQFETRLGAWSPR